MKKTIVSLLLLASGFMLQGQCYEDRHNTTESEGWISCLPSLNPNISRGLSHWLYYDFGDIYRLQGTHFWNLNVPGKTNAGIQRAVIDYSIDGTSWEEWGTFELDEANASGFYEGQAGPDLDNLEARYIIITVIENHGNLCNGLSEVRFATTGTSTSTEELDLAFGELSIFPNPASDITQVKINTDRSLSGEMQIMDMSGQLVHKQNVQLLSGETQIPVDVKRFSTGQYIVNVSGDGFSQSAQLNVVNDN
ncbi:MAG: T9SS type A sorting domain-containing protein [Saprospiraceae bacterium]|nr:T9SS type A sorting domain-containing protein [Saprospiraceae bacterium]